MLSSLVKPLQFSQIELKMYDFNHFSQKAQSSFGNLARALFTSSLESGLDPFLGRSSIYRAELELFIFRHRPIRALEIRIRVLSSPIIFFSKISEKARSSLRKLGSRFGPIYFEPGLGPSSIIFSDDPIKC